LYVALFNIQRLPLSMADSRHHLAACSAFQHPALAALHGRLQPSLNVALFNIQRLPLSMANSNIIQSLPLLAGLIGE
jgi:hypothetical protein